MEEIATSVCFAALLAKTGSVFTRGGALTIIQHKLGSAEGILFGSGLSGLSIW